MDLWLDAYNKQDLENVNVDEKDAEKYDLDIKLVVKKEQPFKISQPSLTPFFIITSENSRYEFLVQSDEPLKNVTLIQGEVGLSVEQMDSTAMVYYQSPIFPPEFSSKIIKGTIAYTSESGKTAYQDVSIRAIYLYSVTTLSVIFIIIFGGLFVYIKRKRIKKVFKK